MIDSTQSAYLLTLEEEHAWLKNSMECVVARTQTFADELFDVTMQLRNVQQWMKRFEELGVDEREKAR